MRVVRVASICMMIAVVAGPAPLADADARQLMQDGVTLEEAGRYSDAIDHLSAALAAKTLSPTDSARALFDRGVAYDGLGNMRAAVADYSGALTLDAALAPALNNRANAYRRTGQLAEAKRDYWAALKIPTGQREFSYYGLGLIAHAEGDTMAARQYFQSALAANPSYGPAAQSLAEIGVGGPKTSDGFRRGTDGEGAVSRRNVRPANREPPEKASSDKVSPDKVSPNKVSQVQLGAFQSEAQALQAWEKIAAAAQGALNGQKPLAVAVDIPGKGRLWRLRTAVASQSAALALCHALAQHGQVCVPARN